MLLKVHVFITLPVFILVASPAYTQSPSGVADTDSANSGLSSASPTASTPANRIEAEHPDKRLFGVLPNYRRIVSSVPFQPLPSSKKLTIPMPNTFVCPPYPIAAVLKF